MFSRREFIRKEREDVFGGPGAWDNADKTPVQCPKEGCDGNEAAFFQVQIRSADEPMTSFYKVSAVHGANSYIPRGWCVLTRGAVHGMWRAMERELGLGFQNCATRIIYPYLIYLHGIGVGQSPSRGGPAMVRALSASCLDGVSRDSGPVNTLIPLSNSAVHYRSCLQRINQLQIQPVCFALWLHIMIVQCFVMLGCY